MMPLKRFTTRQCLPKYAFVSSFDIFLSVRLSSEYGIIPLSQENVNTWGTQTVLIYEFFLLQEKQKWVKGVKIALDLSPMLAGNYSGASCVSYRKRTECMSERSMKHLFLSYISSQEDLPTN